MKYELSEQLINAIAGYFGQAAVRRGGAANQHGEHGSTGTNATEAGRTKEPEE